MVRHLPKCTFPILTFSFLLPAVQCQPPPDVPNGSYSNQKDTAFTPEMFVNYTCDPGYALIGEATIYCTSSGTWSSPAPFCEGKLCHNKVVHLDKPQH